MKAQKYLLQVKKLNRLIINKHAEIKQWKDVAKSMGSYSEGERVQSSGNLQKMESAVCEYTTLESELKKEILKLEKQKQDIVRVIQQLSPKEYNVLHMMYIQIKDIDKDEYYTLYDVADRYDKSYSWATHIHGIALKNVQKIIDRGLE